MLFILKNLHHENYLDYPENTCEIKLFGGRKKIHDKLILKI